VANGFHTRLPDELEAGVDANLLTIWHTSSEFTPDFLSLPIDFDTSDVARVVSRVKIPTIFMFELIRGLNANMTEYELKYGEIKRVELLREDEGSEEP
jgi:hypothetical protein